MNIFTSKQLEESMGLKTNTIHYYVDSGAFAPDIDPGEGRGKSRLFSRTNFVEALLVKRLISFGMPKKRILAFLKSIQKTGDRELLNPDRIWNEKENMFLVFRLQPDPPVTTSDPDPKKIHQFATIPDSVISRWYGSLVINLRVLLSEYKFLSFLRQEESQKK